MMPARLCAALALALTYDASLAVASSLAAVPYPGEHVKDISCAASSSGSLQLFTATVSSGFTPHL
jgi:hypothetical protein